MRERAFPTRNSIGGRDTSGAGPHARGSNLWGDGWLRGTQLTQPLLVRSLPQLPKPVSPRGTSECKAGEGSFETRPDPFRLMCCCWLSWGGRGGQETLPTRTNINGPALRCTSYNTIATIREQATIRPLLCNSRELPDQAASLAFQIHHAAQIELQDVKFKSIHAAPEVTCQETFPLQ